MNRTQTSLFEEITVVNFAGGGGADTGISIATGSPVTIAINHDPDAIRMHRTNHPYTQHLQEDVFEVDPVQVCAGRPVGIGWFSPDCTYHSKARGGKPFEKPLGKKIRGLAWVIVKWALAVKPRVMFLENVEEFQNWGPLVTGADGKDRPDPDRAGETFIGFIAMLTTGIEAGHPALLEACEFLHIEPYGPEAQKLIKGLRYDYDGWELVAADYGVPTIRKRFFGCFRCDGQPIVKPAPTHSKDGKNGLPKWRSAAEIIDWSIPCPSIFASKEQIKADYGVNAVRPLADNTQKRCIRGVDKFTIKSGKPFIVETNHTSSITDYDFFRGGDIDEPIGTITASQGRGICEPKITPFTMSNVTNAAGTDARQPVNTARTGGGCGQMLVTPSLMAIGQTGGGDRIRSADEPVNTQVSKAESCLIAPNLIQYHSEKMHEYVRGQGMSDTLMTVDAANRYGFVSAQLTEYFSNGRAISVTEPMHTVTGRDREAITLAHIAEFRSEDIGCPADNPLRTVASHDHGAVCLSHVIKFKGTNLGQNPTDPLQTITSESGGGSYGVVYTTVEHYPPGADMKHWPKIRALLNQHCGYNLAADEVILLWINGIAYYIADIGLRMLTPRELYNAMGFPADYIIDVDYLGNPYSKSAQVARCGNAVCPAVASALVRANVPEKATTIIISTMTELWQQVAV
jgi:DNA (cytosine-5)-methyltransferase 1